MPLENTKFREKEIAEEMILVGSKSYGRQHRAQKGWRRTLVMALGLWVSRPFSWKIQFRALPWRTNWSQSACLQLFGTYSLDGVKQGTGARSLWTQKQISRFCCCQTHNPQTCPRPWLWEPTIQPLSSESSVMTSVNSYGSRSHRRKRDPVCSFSSGI